MYWVLRLFMYGFNTADSFLLSGNSTLHSRIMELLELSKEDFGRSVIATDKTVPLVRRLNLGVSGLCIRKSRWADWQQLATLESSEGLATSCTWGGKSPEGRSGNIQGIDLVVSGHIGCERLVRRQSAMDRHLVANRKANLYKDAQLVGPIDNNWALHWRFESRLIYRKRTPSSRCNCLMSTITQLILLHTVLGIEDSACPSLCELAQG